jgi:uncharacterized YigZ family protein
MRSFKTIARESFWEMTVERSRFLANSYLVWDEESAAQRLSAQRKIFRGATHYCYAYVLGPNSGISRHSDDGEPSRTAGMPILEAIRGRELFNTLVIVTRYFGGVKLGTGGLVRAYGEAAAKVLEISGAANYAYSAVYLVEFDYAHCPAVEKAAASFGKVLEKDFSGKVAFTIACPAEKGKEFERAISEATCGKASIRLQEQKFLPFL